ncbi:MAG: polyketide synthase dehydratase domain-containing protein [Desulfobacterales bacterium]|nr:polyketide synthase dehydratase domain-containing protein [Desulfobacterales bacterium]
MKAQRREIQINIDPYLQDHHFQGNVIFPCVEAVETIAKTVKTDYPEINIHQIINARFDKFLYISPETNLLTAFMDAIQDDTGNLVATLLTKTSKQTTITRYIEHARIVFPMAPFNVEKFNFSSISALQGEPFQVDRERIYKELVPFGPLFQNICDHLLVTQYGAIATIQAPNVSIQKELGSPFPLDASFHAACVWAQRFEHIVAFPVGFEKRIILNKTHAGDKYITRIIPREKKENYLFFDIWIYDHQGNLYESIRGVKMRDVSGGQLKPPHWIVLPKSVDTQRSFIEIPQIPL